MLAARAMNGCRANASCTRRRARIRHPGDDMRKFRLPLLVASLASLAGAADTPPKPAGDQGNLTPDQEKALKELGNGAASKASLAAEAKYVQALALYRAAHFVEALEAVQEAVNLYPPHDKAQ